MGEYDSGPRPLPWPLLHPLVKTRTVEDDGDFPPSSFVWPVDPNERTTIPFWLSLNEYNILGSTIDVGSDIAFAEDALRVMWLWMRNFRIEVPMPCCDDLTQAILEQDAMYTADQTPQRAVQSKALRDALEAVYDGSPTSINPAAPTTNFGSSGDRYDALCAGLMAFVYQFARGQTDSVRAGQIVGLATIALAAALLIPGLNFFFIVGASIALVAGLGTVGVTTEVAITALTDKSALDNVVCCMRDALRFDAVSEANWLTALNACSFAPGSNEQIVADFILPTLSDNYLTILNILGEAYTGVTGGATLPECPCEPPPAECPDGHFQNYQANNGGMTPYVSRAKYVVGQGWTIGDLPASPSRISIYGNISPQILRAKLVTSSDVGVFRIYKSTGGVLGSQIGVTTTPVISGGVYTWTIPTVTAYAGTEVAFDTGSSGSYAGVYIRSLCWNY